MDPRLILYQDTVDSVLTIAPPTKTPSEDACFICGQEYGSAGPGWQHNLHFLDQLPGAFRPAYVQRTIEAVRTPCNHTFCIFCLSVWLLKSDACTCPMCRTPIQLPNLPNVENTDDGQPHVGIEGLSTSLHVPTTVASAVYKILRMQTRGLLNTDTDMPFIWNVRAMLYDLPRVMVTIARRFHYQSSKRKDAMREEVLKDLSYTKLHNPADRMLPCKSFGELKSLTRRDAPLASHPDAIRMYEYICLVIADLKDVIGDRHGRCPNWEGPARTIMYKLVNEGMPEATGGVGQRGWWAYVLCVVKALFVWQAYCERARRLMQRRV
jgi:hypothetical protein